MSDGILPSERTTERYGRYALYLQIVIAILGTLSYFYFVQYKVDTAYNWVEKEGEGFSKEIPMMVKSEVKDRVDPLEKRLERMEAWQIRFEEKFDRWMEKR